MIGDAVHKACGNADGLIEDPTSRSFTPKQLQCTAGDAPNCLTTEEVGVLDKWYVDARNSKGEVLYPGAIPKGSEPFWPMWLTGDEKGSPALVPLFGRDFVRYMAFPDDPGENCSILGPRNLKAYKAGRPARGVIRFSCRAPTHLRYGKNATCGDIVPRISDSRDWLARRDAVT